MLRNAQKLVVTPLCELRLCVVISFMDGQGTLRNFDDCTDTDVHATSEGSYEGVFNVKDCSYWNHFGLTGEYSIRIELGTLIGIPGGLRRPELVVACLSRKKIGDLIARVRKAKESPVMVTIPGFVRIAKEDHSENSQVIIEFVMKKRIVLIKSVKVTLPIEDAEYVVERIALYKKQMSSC